MNVIIVLVLAISQPCVGDPALKDTQLINPVNRENLEGGPRGPVATNDLTGQQAGAGNLAETTLTTPEEASAPVAAHHKTITREDHSDMENTASQHTGIRLAI